MTKIEELAAEAEDDLKIERSQLDYESLRTPKIHNKWLRKLYSRKDMVYAYELKRKEILRDRHLYYTGKAPDEVYATEGAFNLKVLKPDLALFVDADPKLQAIDTKIHSLKQELDFIQKTIDECNRRSFHISNALKAIAFMNGQS